uniref:EGF-like domain-containing protein n=1 Tax=Globisporangium ultimum (strain ATCC 200006 / CBS 805.95 / DAOM BR144) TaxID=431595 RepID=K3WZA2_GLOUD
MKISSIISTLALSSAVSHAATTTTASTDFPGQCSPTNGCNNYGTGYKCIAVDTNTPGLENLNMCIPGDACSGDSAGACPTFSAWPKAYRAVQPVCTFVPAANCKNSENSETGQVNGTVDCYTRSYTINSEVKEYSGFFSCVDRAKYSSLNPLNMTAQALTNLTTDLATSCVLSSTANTLCSGQGTCALTTAATPTFECKCNKGYDQAANCSTVISNECSSLGQCGTEGTCIVGSDQTTGTCTCSEGTTGLQCTKCDSDSSNACNAHGTCSAGVCTCATGYSGTFCSDADATPAPVTTKPVTATPTSTSSVAPVKAPAMLPTLFATALAAIAVAHLVSN